METCSDRRPSVRSRGDAILVLAITVYSRLFLPGITDARYQELGEQAGYYVAPTAGALTTFLIALWIGRRLDSRRVGNGVMVGVLSVILTAGFLLTARPEHRVMYMIAFALRVAAGYLGGWMAQKRAGEPSAAGRRLAT